MTLWVSTLSVRIIDGLWLITFCFALTFSCLLMPSGLLVLCYMPYYLLSIHPCFDNAGKEIMSDVVKDIFAHTVIETWLVPRRLIWLFYIKKIGAWWNSHLIWNLLRKQIRHQMQCTHVGESLGNVKVQGWQRHCGDLALSDYMSNVSS